MSKKTEELWQLFSLINSWIKFAEVKATALLAAHGVVASVMLSNITIIKNLSSISILNTVILAIGIIAFMVSVCYSIMCVLPQLKAGKPSSLIYFNHISQFNLSEYEDKLDEMLSDKDDYKKQLTFQIWKNSEVATNKFKWVAISTISLLITLACGSMLTILYIGGS